MPSHLLQPHNAVEGRHEHHPASEIAYTACSVSNEKYTASARPVCYARAMKGV
jgi:hypothetical protein